MKLYHATTVQRLAQIREQGLRVACADPAAKIKGCWLHTSSQSAWAVVHTQRKHGATLEEVVVVAVEVQRSRLTRFRTGLWYTRQDIPASAIGEAISGAAFGASAQ